MKPLQVLNSPATLPPFPNGWYVVAFSKDLRPGGLLKKTLAGRELVLFRTEAGVPSLIDAYCPHMGAHFGHGGCVKGETIQCPFHDFRFDTKGVCVATGYNTKPPPKARAKTLPLREINGVLLAYHDGEGNEPTWEVPAIDFTGWLPLRSATWKIRGHPQETSENSADVGHLSIIHKYRNVEMTGGRAEGPLFRTGIAFDRPGGFFDNPKKSMRAQAEIYVYGLGFSYVEVTLPSYGLATRQFVLSTPLDGEHIELSIAISIKAVTEPGKLHPLAKLVPRSLLHEVLGRVAIRTYSHDVQQDFKIWNHKKYVHPPALAEGDGPVGKYRQWARQFYPEFTEPQQARITSAA